MYMLDSDQELSYNLSKNLLLLLRILKLIKDMVDDSTPLLLFKYILPVEQTQHTRHFFFFTFGRGLSFTTILY